MTPDHLHAPIAIAAMKRGKHVITHKPIANRIKEGKLTIDTARKTGVKAHLLAWSRRPEYELIKQWIDDGVIGTLKEIHNWSFDGVCKPVVNDVAFPYSSLIQLKYPAQTSLPAFDLYWYDGGMKPFAPAELEIDDRDTPNEGLMFVGTDNEK